MEIKKRRSSKTDMNASSQFLILDMLKERINRFLNTLNYFSNKTC